jgi:hypothetical protein
VYLDISTINRGPYRCTIFGNAAASVPRNETHLLSLTSALRVNSGTITKNAQKRSLCLTCPGKGRFRYLPSVASTLMRKLRADVLLPAVSNSTWTESLPTKSALGV